MDSNQRNSIVCTTECKNEVNVIEMTVGTLTFVSLVGLMSIIESGWPHGG